MRRERRSAVRIPANQSGVALVIVLLMSLIIAVVALYFSVAAREELHRAQALVDHQQAQQEADSLAARILFAWLTEGDAQAVAQASGASGAGWNYRGQPIQYDEGSTVRLWDLAGQFSLIPFNEDWLTAFLDQRFPRRVAEQAVGRLGERLETRSEFFQTADPDPFAEADESLPPQGVIELKSVAGLSEEVYAALEPQLSYYGPGYLNPQVASEAVLAAALGEQRAEAIAADRSHAEQYLRGLEQSTSFDPPPYIVSEPVALTVEVTTQHGEGQARRRLTAARFDEGDEAWQIWRWE
jgi:type II secretory pathway component PulK